MLMGQPAAAAGPLERLYRRAAEQGEEMGLAEASALMAQAELAAGNWERAGQLAGEVRSAGRQADVSRSFGFDLYIASLVEAHLGNLDQARAAATALVELAARRGLVPLLWQGRAVLGFVSLCSGDAQGAHAQFGSVIDSLRQLGVREWGLVHLVWSGLISMPWSSWASSARPPCSPRRCGRGGAPWAGDWNSPRHSGAVASCSPPRAISPPRTQP